MMQRTRWTKEEIKELQKIYEEQKQNGDKKLWVRITKRINQNVRNAKRQAIEYKWKNHCIIAPTQFKLCQNQKLIELLFQLIPTQGYKKISKHSSFIGVSESNIKNIFYSNIRSISNFLYQHIKTAQSVTQITNMLKNRQFLLEIKESNIDFIEFRRKIQFLKKYMVGRKKDDQMNGKILHMKIQIKNIYNQIRTLYCSLDDRKASKTTIQSKTYNPQETENKVKRSGVISIYIKYPTSMQLLENNLNKIQIQEQRKKGTEFSLGEWNHSIFSSSQGLFSLQWLCSDF